MSDPPREADLSGDDHERFGAAMARCRNGDPSACSSAGECRLGGECFRPYSCERGSPPQVARRHLVLSIFPGIDLLGRGFEAEGFCIVRGPDPLFGGDIRDFRPPRGHIDGVIGGPPCQDFSSIRRAPPTGEGEAMLAEFARVVAEAGAEWWLLENVARVPDVQIDGYTWQRFEIDEGWYSEQSRLRHIQFGSRSGRVLDVEKGPPVEAEHGAALASDRRSLAELRELQGLPADFDLPGFKREAAKRAIGNGVPYGMAKALAAAVRRAFDEPHEAQLSLFGGPPATTRPVCRCGCGRRLSGRERYASPACRKRAQRRRDRLN